MIYLLIELLTFGLLIHQAPWQPYEVLACRVQRTDCAVRAARVEKWLPASYYSQHASSPAVARCLLDADVPS